MSDGIEADRSALRSASKTGEFGENFAWTAMSGLVTLEKWYVDTLLDDGAVLIIYLGLLRGAGIPVARATAEYFPVTGSAVSGRSRARPIENDSSHVRIGDVELDARGVRFAAAPIRGELAFAPRAESVALVAPFLRDGLRTLSWTVEVPDADVEGTLEISGASQNVRGRGYRDRVATNILPWRFPIRTLCWGRACAGKHAATWVDAAAAGGEHIAAALVDGVIRHAAAGVPPEVVLTDAHTLVETRVASHDALGLGVFRPVARFLYGDPHEEKRAGGATIRGDTGFAIWETVRFGAPP